MGNKMKVYGVLIKLKDGVEIRENFNSNALGNILGTFRGNLDCEQSMKTNEVYPLTGEKHNDIRDGCFINDAEERVLIPFSRISFIKYKENKGVIGPEKQKGVYDWEEVIK